MPIAITSGPTRKLKLVSLKVTKFPIPVVTPFKGKAITHANSPPSSDSNSDSIRKLSVMLPRVKPRMRSVPTSFARRATAAYMVFIAAKQLPIAMMMQTKIPRNFTGREEIVCAS